MIIDQICQLFINPQIEKRIINIFFLSMLANVSNNISEKNLFILFKKKKKNYMISRFL